MKSIISEIQEKQLRFYEEHYKNCNIIMIPKSRYKEFEKYCKSYYSVKDIKCVGITKVCGINVVEVSRGMTEITVGLI